MPLASGPVRRRYWCPADLVHQHQGGGVAANADPRALGHSSMKVDCARWPGSSAAPMRVGWRRWGPGGRRRRVHGCPCWPAARSRPPAHVGRFTAHVGPVMICMRVLAFSRVWLAMKAPLEVSARRASTTGGGHPRSRCRARDELRRAPVQRERALGQRAQHRTSSVAGPGG